GSAFRGSNPLSPMIHLDGARALWPAPRRSCPRLVKGPRGLSLGRGQAQDLRAVARPPLRPAAFFCAVVPPCFELPPEPDFLPPRADAPGELAIFAARSLDIPLSLSACYCSSFLT